MAIPASAGFTITTTFIRIHIEQERRGLLYASCVLFRGGQRLLGDIRRPYEEIQDCCC
jgi:hypothetical protein